MAISCMIVVVFILHLDLVKFGRKKKIEKITFFLMFGLEKIAKKNNMEESQVEKKLERSDKIFLIKLWKSLRKISNLLQYSNIA